MGLAKSPQPPVAAPARAPVRTPVRTPLAAFAGAAALILLLFVLDHTSSMPRYAMSAWALAAIAYGTTVYRPKHACV